MDTGFNPFSLAGKRVLVVGASSGIGRACAIACSKMGAAVFLAARRRDKLEETASLMDGDSHQIIVADITSEAGLEPLMSSCPVIDGLVLSVGKSEMSPFLFCTREKFDSTFELNFFGPVEVLRRLAKGKKLSKGSSAVVIASIGGTPGGKITTANAVYGASKAALVSVVKYAAKELAPKRIRVNSINPGMIETAMIHSGMVTDEQHQKDMECYPLKRYGRPEDVANGAVYLLSDASSWITGQSLIIDGGITI